jgi:aspartate/methionine/tyrosine aminotransferase
MNFSTRTNWDLAENDFTVAVRKARASGGELFDLTVSNPTDCDFLYDAKTILKPLSQLEAMHYEPDPLGMATARAAVAQYYRDAGAEVAVERICLTTSTSEAYSFLFRLLCDSGDEVLIARPSYPLFDFIARLDDVRLVEYPLLYDYGWHIDLHALEQAITPRTRAIVVVHPNNPTGNFACEVERAALDELCARRDLTLIVDEVFLDYSMDERKPRSFAAGRSQALTFVLSGLSKVCGLPQMKVSWIAANGPDDAVASAMARMEVIADTFLSMNAPMQQALPHWLAGREELQQQIRRRMRTNLAVLDARLPGTQANRLVMQGGWTVVLRVPRTVKGRPFAEAALEHGVVVQPGEFYGLPEGRVVLSLLTPSSVWERGLALLPID